MLQSYTGEKVVVYVKLWAQISKVVDVDEQFEADIALYFKFTLPNFNRKKIGAEGEWVKVRHVSITSDSRPV